MVYLSCPVSWPSDSGLSLPASVKPSLPAPVFLEVLGDGAWNPFLDCRALLRGQVYVPAGFESCSFLSLAGSTPSFSPLTHPESGW